MANVGCDDGDTRTVPVFGADGVGHVVPSCSARQAADGRVRVVARAVHSEVPVPSATTRQNVNNGTGSHDSRSSSFSNPAPHQPLTRLHARLRIRPQAPAGAKSDASSRKRLLCILLNPPRVTIMRLRLPSLCGRFTPPPPSCRLTVRSPALSTTMPCRRWSRCRFLMRWRPAARYTGGIHG